MRVSLNVKTLFRTPLKTFLTFLLLGATSYLLFFGVAEYAAVSSAMEQAVGFYHGVGAVEVDPPFRQIPEDFWPDHIPKNVRTPVSVSGLDFYLYADERVAYNPYGDTLTQYSYTGLSQSSVDAIAALPYVSRASVRYMTAGVSETLERSYDASEYFKYTARFVAEATVDSVALSMPVPGYRGPAEYNLQFRDFKLLAGDPRSFKDLSDIFWKATNVYAETFNPDYDGVDTVPVFTWLTNNTLVRFVIHASETYRSEVYSADFLESLVPGERYVIIGRYTPISMSHIGLITNVDMSLSDPMTLDWCPQIYPLEGQPENYLDLPEFALLREIIGLTNADSHTLDVVYTDDMSAIMCVAEGSIQVTDGRALTIGDSENRNNVCVMNSAYMVENGLEIGDRVTLKLGDMLFEQNMSLGAVAVVRERYPDVFTEVEFEIVGAFRDVTTQANQVENLHWAYSRNTVFVPLPFLPVEVPSDHIVRPGELSIIIDDPRDISAFLEESRPVIENELGLTLFFSDGGWTAIESQIRQALASAVVRLTASSLSVAVAVCLIAYLFIWRKRKEYAIVRAMGTTKHLANRSMYLPLAVVGITATAAGTALGKATAVSRIENVLAPFTEAGIESPTGIPGYLAPFSYVCALAMLALFTAVMLRRTGAKPPLELLQAGEGMGVGKNEGRRYSTEEAARLVDLSATSAIADTAHGNSVLSSEHLSHIPSVETVNPVQTLRKQSAARQAARYTARHIRRSPIKSLLYVGLALLLAGAAGQLTVLRGMYRGMYSGVDQKAFIINGITLRGAIDSTDFDQIKAAYFENTVQTIVCQHSNFTAVITNDIARYSSGAVEIEFLDGYSYESQNTVDQPMYGPSNKTCVMDDGFMRSLGLELGDTVRFTSWFEHGIIHKEHFGLPPLDIDPAELRKQYESLETLFDDISVFFTVVGREVSGSAPDTVFIPVTRGIDSVIPLMDNKILEYAEFTLTSPEYSEDFRSFIEPNIKGPAVGDVGSPFMMDTSEADNILERVRLLETLYPIAVAIMVVLSGLFPGLAVMQSDRDAAIIRALGAAKKRVRGTLALEQATLCMIGLLCAAALLCAINGSTLASYAAVVGICAAAQLAACIAGSLICAVVITRRRVLELLQVKE